VSYLADSCRKFETEIVTQYLKISLAKTARLRAPLAAFDTVKFCECLVRKNSRGRRNRSGRGFTPKKGGLVKCS